MSDDLLPVDGSSSGSEPSEELQTLDELHDIQKRLDESTDALRLLVQADNESAEGVVVLSGEQYSYFMRSLQMQNSLGLVMMLLLGIICGLSAWRAFVHSWGSHG